MRSVQKMFAILLMTLITLSGLFPLHIAYASKAAAYTDCTPTSGTTIIVNSTKDDGTDLSTECTLREAVDYINSNSGGTINFSTGSNAVIYLESVLELSYDLVIDGDNNGDGVTLDGINNSDDNLIYFYPDSSEINLDISNITLKNSIGPAIYSDGYGGDVTVDSSTFTNNNTEFVDYGGAINWEASSDSFTLTISNSTFSNNQSDGYENHPNYSGGGAIYAAYGNVTITNSSFTANNSIGFCGAIDFRADSPVEFSIDNSTFSSNTSGSNDLNISGGGGAVCVKSTGTSVIKNSTFDDNNSTYQGGALFNGSRFGTLYVINSTFSGNSSYAQGSVFSGAGGWDVFASPQVKEFSTFKIYNSTIANNFGTAPVADQYRSPVFDNHSSHYYIYNSVIANNTATYQGALCWTEDDNDTNGEGYVKGDHNLVYGNNSTTDLSTCPSDSSDDMLFSGNYITGDPKLVALSDNGGATKTMALGSGSAAIDAVDLSGCVYDDGTSTGVTLATDQRGYGRPVNTNCDLGAFEYGAVSNEVTITDDDVELTYDVSSPDAFSFTFNKDVYDPAGDTDPKDVTNPANWLFVELGANTVLDTETCSGGVITDDVAVSISSVTYDQTSMTATINLATPLSDGDYAIFACGTTSIYDSTGTYKLNGGVDSVFEFTVTANSTPTPNPNESEENSNDSSVLPDTGFAQGRVSSLPEQPAAKGYSATAITLSIPSLGITAPIVGVPHTDNGWDVTWLGSNLGWLQGTAYPTWQGNTVLTGHVWDAFNQPGVFFGLNKLAAGDQIELNAYGSTYVYEVKESVLRWSSEGFDTVIKHHTDDWLTLITCEGYMPSSDLYLFRRVVGAKLVAIK